MAMLTPTVLTTLNCKYLSCVYWTQPLPNRTLKFLEHLPDRIFMDLREILGFFPKSKVFLSTVPKVTWWSQPQENSELFPGHNFNVTVHNSMGGNFKPETAEIHSGGKGMKNPTQIFEPNSLKNLLQDLFRVTLWSITSSIIELELSLFHNNYA